MTTLQIVAMSEDSDWYAFPAHWTRHQVASELADNLADWWLSEHPATWIDDNDVTHGWVTVYRDLLSRIKRSFIRYEPLTDGTDWWWACDETHPNAQPAWVVRL